MPVDLVEHECRVLEPQVAERHLDLRVGDPLRRGDDDDLVGVLDGEGRDRRGHAGPEVEQDHLVEAAQEREQLAVELGRHLRHDRRIGGRREQVQAAGEPRDVGAQLAGRADPLLVAQQLDERQRRPRPVGREVGERAEVRVEVDGQRPQPQVAGEHVAGEERARGLAAAALRRQRRHDVGARHAGQPAQAALQLGLLALA